MLPVGETLLDKESYRNREQTYIKHFVLERYLERLAFKIGMGTSGPTLNYVDGFAGPWKHADEGLQDTSPFIAISKLRDVRTALRERNRSFRFRCLFIEKERGPFRQLESEARTVSDAEIIALHGKFEDYVPNAATFASAGRKPFAFFFIDPTGWTGYRMSALKRLLDVHPSEILINFMTSFVDRFVHRDTPALRSGFQDLFGDGDFRHEWRSLEGLDREDAIVEAYCRRIRDVGRFQFVGSAVVLKPDFDRSLYHLVYATRHPKGIEVFREVEEKAFSHQSEFRSDLAQSRRVSRTGQGELFQAASLSGSYEASLIHRYRTRSKAALKDLLRKENRTPYDRAEEVALSFPLTSSRQLKEWIAEWGADGRIKVEGLTARERVPKARRGHFLVWQT